MTRPLLGSPPSNPEKGGGGGKEAFSAKVGVGEQRKRG